MNSIRAGLRNVYRNKARAFVIVLVLSLSISVALAMSSVQKNVGSRLDELRSGVGTQLELRPAGSYGLSHSSSDKSAKYLEENITQKIAALDNMRSARGYLSAMGDFAGEHVVVMGIEPGAGLSIFGGGAGKLKSGELLDKYSAADYVVLVGEGYAKRHNAGIGDKVKLKDSEVTVVGIFSSDTAYGDHGIFVPLGTMQEIFGLDGQFSSIFVDIDSIENAGLVTLRIKNISESIDVVDKDKPIRSAVEASLGSAQATGRAGALLSLMVGSAIVFFTMLLVTRERKREIGTLKAIGASNSDILKQFLAETSAIALGAAVLGVFLTYMGGGMIAALLLPDTGGAAEAAQKDMRNMGVYSSASGISASIPSSLFAFDFSGIIYAVGIAFLLSTAGMAYPAFKIFGMKPAEALKHE